MSASKKIISITINVVKTMFRLIFTNLIIRCSLNFFSVPTLAKLIIASRERGTNPLSAEPKTANQDDETSLNFFNGSDWALMEKF